jgi:hypothetical protein
VAQPGSSLRRPGPQLLGSEPLPSVTTPVPGPVGPDRARASPEPTFDKEYMGIKQPGVFETVRMEEGMKIMGMTTRTEYKVTNGVFENARSDYAPGGPAGRT